MRAKVSAAVVLLLLIAAAAAQAQVTVKPWTSTWNEGSENCMAHPQPPLEVHEYDSRTFVLRESLCSTWEAPFMYLLLGNSKALLIDTGDVADPRRMPLAHTVLQLVSQYGSPGLALLVVHTHRHLDHRSADPQFEHLPRVRVVDYHLAGVRQYFGFTHWPQGHAQIDLGNRVVDVLPAPGHEATHLVFYDRSTGLLLSGDFMMPGRLLVADAAADLLSARRVAEFISDKPVSAVLGGHIEEDADGRLFPWESTFHPHERSLAMAKADLLALPAALQGFNGFYSRRGKFLILDPIHNLIATAAAALIVLIAAITGTIYFFRRRRRRRANARLGIATFLGGLVLISGAASAHAGISRGDHYAGEPWATRSPVLAQHGMIASEQPLASLAGLEILKKGGSAVDAAIATSAMLCLTEPVLNGLGADAFVIVWDPKKHKLYGYNSSGWSPKNRSLRQMQAQVRAAYENAGMKPADQIPLLGPLPVTVPGIVDAWFALHEKFGKLPIAEDLAPAIQYASHGFPVTEVVAEYWQGNWQEFEKHRGLIKDFENAQKVFLIDGHTPREGEVFRNPDMAHTLRELASGGRDAFYKGRIAHTMADFFQSIGGGLEYSDFADFHGEWVTPQSVDYRGYDVYELPPNGQGFATLEMLNVLNGFDLEKMGVGSPDTLMAEIGAFRLAAADLSKWYADPRFYQSPAKGLLSRAYADQRRKLLNLQHANPDIAPGNPLPYQTGVYPSGSGDTTDFETADDNGMMVSMIESNFAGMGSGEAAPGLGFIFQDRGALYSLDPKVANAYAPRKRPFHTIIPAFVMKGGKPWMAFGVMGGYFQPQGQTQVLVNMIDFGMNVQEAGDAARWDHTGDATPTGLPAVGAGTVMLESGFDPGVADTLGKRGYEVRITPHADGGYGGYEAIQYDPRNHIYRGATEMRRDGEVTGY